MKALITTLIPMAMIASVGLALGVSAKLPAPPPADPVKAEEKKAKDAAAAASGAALQAKAEDRVAARYITDQKAKGKPVTPQMAPNWGDLDVKAREAASKVPGAQAAPAVQTMAAARPVAVKK